MLRSECQVCGCAAQDLARAVRPDEVAGLEAAAVDDGPEVGVAATGREVIEDDPDGLVGEQRGAPSGTVTSSPWTTTWVSAPW
jgi:hypothetical protein